MRLYAPMLTFMNQICSGYSVTELERIAEFLGLVADAGRNASENFDGDGHHEES